MSYTLEDAWREEAYDHMVEEVLEAHRADIILEFARSRLQSYYLENLNIADAAQRTYDEARRLVLYSLSASLVFSTSSIEITLRDVIMKPLAYGFVHDEGAGPLMAELVVSNRHFKRLLFHVLEESGHIGLQIVSRKKGLPSVWAEKEQLKQVRDKVVHKGELATPEQAEASLDLADYFLNRLYPQIRRQIAGLT